MHNHTPGPWTIRGSVHPVGNDEDGIHDLYCADVIPPHDERWRGTVCGIQSADHIDGISKEEAEANARLIAAAPDLLQALLDALPFVEDAESDPCFKKGFVKKRVKAIRAAIAKAGAEGVSHG